MLLFRPLLNAPKPFNQPIVASAFVAAHGYLFTQSSSPSGLDVSGLVTQAREFLQHLDIYIGRLGAAFRLHGAYMSLSNFAAITEALSHLGGTYKNDVSIPLPELYQLAEDCLELLTQLGFHGCDESKPVQAVVGYGHMSDSNLHLNISVRQYSKEIEKAIEPWIYEWIQKRNGSISAEHGLGLAKKELIGYSQNDTMIKTDEAAQGLVRPGELFPYHILSGLHWLTNFIEWDHEPVQAHLNTSLCSLYVYNIRLEIYFSF